MAPPKYVDRVKALLAKAESTEFEGERESLLDKAYDLMRQHAILSKDLRETEDPIEFRSAHLLGEHVMPWAFVGQALGFVVTLDRGRGVAFWYGYRSDLEFAELLWNSLKVQMIRAVASYVEIQQFPIAMQVEGRSSFLAGWAHTVSLRITLSRSRVEEHSGSGLHPVLLDRENRVRSWVTENLNADEDDTVPQYDTQAFHQGRFAGQSADIQQPRINSVRGELG